MEQSESFGALLNEYRQRAGIAQNALARAAGINVGTVNRLERDQRLPASRRQVLDLAAALSLSRAEANRLLHAAALPAEGFGPAITGDPVLCEMAAVLQDETISPAARADLRAIIDHGVRLTARTHRRQAGV